MQKKKKSLAESLFFHREFATLGLKKKKGTNVKGGWVNEYREYSCSNLWRRER